MMMMIAAAGWTVVLPASAGVAAVAVSLVPVSSPVFLPPADCLAESLVAGGVCTWTGSAGGATSLAFAASGCGGEFGLVVLCGLAVATSCTEGLVLPGAVEAVLVLLAVVVFAAGWLFGSCDVCAGGGLLPFCVGGLDFAALVDWKLLSCRG